jgi:uncharacterized protein with von Willebrand factor type A (vWA) domain
VSYPFGSLPDNLTAFCGVLRREYGFRIGAGQLHDAARALELVELADEMTVRNALRPILSGTRQDSDSFDRAFTEFFLSGSSGEPQAGRPPARRELGSESAEGEEGPERRARSKNAGTEEKEDAKEDEKEDEEEEALRPPGGPVTPRARAEPEAAAPALLARASYSPLEADAPGPEIAPVGPEWRDAARLLVRRVQLGLARRWRPAARGRRFDLRRTLRASLQTGGEPLHARWLRPRRRAPRFCLLIDGSRSMAENASVGLQIAVAVASVTMRVEAFAFSTSLRRVTQEVRRAALGASRRLEHLQYAWGGGTNIGGCLRALLQQWGERAVNSDTVVILASDGLDVGDPEVLREAMRELRRRSAGFVWLNPLLESPGYAPTAAGMTAARPFITTFTSVRDPGALAQLSRKIRLRV